MGRGAGFSPSYYPPCLLFSPTVVPLVSTARTHTHTHSPYLSLPLSSSLATYALPTPLLFLSATSFPALSSTDSALSLPLCSHSSGLLPLPLESCPRSSLSFHPAPFSLISPFPSSPALLPLSPNVPSPSLPPSVYLVPNVPPSPAFHYYLPSPLPNPASLPPSPLLSPPSSPAVKHCTPLPQPLSLTLLLPPFQQVFGGMGKRRKVE